MKRLLVLGLVLAISVSLFACRANDGSPAKLAAGRRQQTDLPADASGSGVNTKTASSQPVNWSAGEQIAVQGENIRLALHSLDFIDAHTGWLVADEFGLPWQESEILKTQDAGANWEKIKLNNTAVQRLMFVNQTTGWAIAQAAGQTTPGVQVNDVKILHTRDGGETWDVQWEDAVQLSGGDLWFQDKMHGYALISGILLATRDGGKNWSPVSFGVNGFKPQHISFINARQGWVIGTVKEKGQDNGNKLVTLHTANEGQKWQQQFARDYPDGPVGSIAIDFINATTGWFLTSNLATWAGDLYYTANGGGDWQQINQVKCVRPTPTAVQFITPQVGWIPLDVGAGPVPGGLLRTRDGGKNFARVESGGESIREVAFSSPQQGWAVGTAHNYGDYLIRTTNGGQSWTQVFPRPRPTADISFVDNEHGFGLGQLADSGALLASSDGGNTWQKVYRFSSEFYPGMLSFIDRHTGWVLAAVKDSNKLVMLKTTDGGYSWTPLAGDIPPVELYATSYFRFFDPEHGMVIATVGDKMVFYRTQDGGKTWTWE